MVVLEEKATKVSNTVHLGPPVLNLNQFDSCWGVSVWTNWNRFSMNPQQEIHISQQQ